MSSLPRGFAYLALLFMTAMLAVGALTLTSVDYLANQRSKEQALLAIGHEYRRALSSYRDAVQPHVYPETLDQLLEDRRGGVLRRHLRKAYGNPIEGGTAFQLVVREGRIVGVHPASEAEPLKIAGFDAEDETFAGKQHYSGWVFLAEK